VLVIGDRGSDVEPPGFADREMPFEPVLASSVDRWVGSVTVEEAVPLDDRAARPAPIPRNAATLRIATATRDRAAACLRLRRGACGRATIVVPPRRILHLRLARDAQGGLHLPWELPERRGAHRRS
jgi:hypothetical protein